MSVRGPWHAALLSPEDLRPLRTASSDYAETELLKRRLAERRRDRVPFFLKLEDLDPVFHWLLRGQHGRQRAMRDATPEEQYESVTRAAFSIHADGSDAEAHARVLTLMSLRGVGISTASAILALVDPDHYCVVSSRGWHALYGVDRREFGVTHFLYYRNDVAKLASALDWPVQEVDLAIWAYDEARD